jgi:hypothetical protein
MYEADDGSKWSTMEQADRRDQLIRAVKYALEPLGDLPRDDGCRFANGHRYIQHTPGAVQTAKARLITASESICGKWIEEHRENGYDSTDMHPSWFQRFADDSGCTPLSRAWGRFACIDLLNREWGQPFFANNPDQAPDQTPLNQEHSR